MNPIDTAEAELQQELRELFSLDTQQHLEVYFRTIAQLNAKSWTADIQQIYRAIHTIKGGAVTVSADAILQVAIVLEDLLSDLRYLEEAPVDPNVDLGQILLEAGELLSSSIEITETGDRAIERVQPTVNRLMQLHDLVKQQYLPDWNELKQAHQEFAEQGFDLVILELEIALEKMSGQGIVSTETIAIAQATIGQLTQIGVDIELAAGWTILLQQCQDLVTQPNCQLWTEVWFEYFELLKICLKNSGDLAEVEIERLEGLAGITRSAQVMLPNLQYNSPNLLEHQANSDLLAALDDFFLSEDDDNAAFFQSEAESEVLHPNADLVNSLDNFFLEVDDDATFVQSDAEVEEFSSDLVDLFDNLATTINQGQLNSTQTPSLNKFESLDYSSLLFDDFDQFTNYLEAKSSEFLVESELESSILVNSGIVVESESALIHDPEITPILLNTTELSIAGQTADPLSPPIRAIIAPVKRSIQIPVPLDRLDQSAKQVVETLLTARAVTSISTQLQSQLCQLTTLTRENSQFITRLRQLQDDYVLLRNLSDKQDSGNNVTLERYDQGYSTIVCLLDNILRLSELGQEIESSTYQSAIRMDALDRSILQLKDGIETSRLVPFRNLTLRSKAILRDLTIRYGKPVELIIDNEHIEIDAGIIQQLEPALLHLLRNAYDHGLESVQQRLTAGKPAQGKIQISIQQRGNLYLLTIEDDGGGIDAQRVHDLAVSKGFSLTQTRTNAELLAVLCQPGFSSSSKVSEVSGRGVGMDVVVAQITSIGGQLTLETFAGQGTKFAIEIPAPQLLIPCVMFQVGDRIIALPTDNVLETRLLSSMNATLSCPQVGLCTLNRHNLHDEIHGFDLNNYWQAGNNSAPRSLPDTAVCIRLRQAPDTPEVWSIADDLIGQAKLLINPLPSPLVAPVGLLGVSLQPDGRLISVLDPIALSLLIASRSINTTVDFVDQTEALHVSAMIPVKSSTPTILIVDDAAMIRRRLEASLNTYGFITHTCNDGLEALKWLQANPTPDLMITDVEMPNMDGFTLISRLRQARIELPILVVSSRSSATWGKEARRLGAADYLNKGFATSEMIQKVNSLLGLLVDV
jgi:chemotaxis protein histidine kinase CheA